MIITEGKTDPVYIREAVKQRINYFPELGAQTKEGFKHSIRYFNYTGLAQEILGLYGGGTGNLKSIPLGYGTYLHSKKGITHLPMKFPVIIILDNDEGLKDFVGTVNNKFKVVINRKTTSDFYHVTDNLYVVKTPEVPNQDTCIEMLFPEKWLKVKLGEKKFSLKSKIDHNKEYGKDKFANCVIKPNSQNIDFSEFDPFLKRIVDAIRHYANKKN